MAQSSRWEGLNKPCTPLAGCNLFWSKSLVILPDEPG